MSKPLIVSIPHQLGKAEAVKRLQSGLQWAKDKYGGVLAVQKEEWSGDQLAFQVGALGQSAQGSIVVSDSDVTLAVQLPWLLARFAEKAQALLQKQGQLMLEKKVDTV